HRPGRPGVPVLDGRTGKRAREVAHPTSPPPPVLSADGTWLVAFSPPHLRLWNTATGQELPPVTAQPVAMALNADGHLLVTAEARRVCAWNTATGRLLQTWGGPPGFYKQVALG